MDGYVSALAVAFVGVLEAEAAPPICKRIRNDLNQCEVTPRLANGSMCSASATPCTEQEENNGQCTGSNKLPWVDVLAFREKLLSDLVPANGPASLFEALKAACHTYALETENSAYDEWDDGEAEWVTVLDAESGICMIDRNGDGDAKDVPDDYATGVRVELKTPEPHCYLTPNGPYRLVPGGGNTSGAAFSSDPAYRTSIRNTQWAHRYPSGIGPTGPFSDGGVWRDAAFASVFTPSRVDGLDFFTKLRVTSGFQDSVEFHHIIPARDSQGCKCGPNTNANLALVSRQLNGASQMSNNIRHPATKALMDKWTL